LIGRCGRQGDPGSCQLFAAADDEVITTFGGSARKRMGQLAAASGEVSAGESIDLDAIQRRAETADFERRRHLMRQEIWVSELLDTLVRETA